MIEPLEKRAGRSILKKRQEEIEGRLAASGLARGGRRVLRAVESGGEETRGSRLRRALESLGPIFSSFGRYMSTRVDLLSARTCVELAAIPDRAVPMPLADAHALLGRELGCEPAEVFPNFEAAACESRLTHQTHRAWLPGGEPVSVKLIHSEAEEYALRDLQLLHLLEGAFAWEVSGQNFKSAANDFAVVLRQQIDFAHEAKALVSLAQDAEVYETLRVPAVRPELCTSRVLTIERLTGWSLEESARSFEEGADDARRGLTAGLNATGIARLLCSVWMRQALLGRAFPVEPRPEDILILPGRQIAFTGGLFAGLAADPQANLWDYLIAAAGENTDLACACLLKEMRASEQVPDEERLRHSFRQVVPFRDSQWRGSGDEYHLAEHLFVQWRLASECGYVPLPHLPSFYRGLFLITDAAQRLAPDSDPLAEGLQDVRLLASLSQWREMMTRSQLGEQFDK
ncbi:MAG: hypothetical protein LC802_22870, partial [Acidobacteria bacterium]|nr:hypothetical protein [Acidobacteriota bacterium]